MLFQSERVERDEKKLLFLNNRLNYRNSMLLIVIPFFFVFLHSEAIATSDLLSWDEFKAKYQLSFDASQESTRQQYYYQNLSSLIANPCPYCGITKFFASTLKQIQKGSSLKLLDNTGELAAQQQKQNQSDSYLTKALTDVKVKWGSPSSLDWRDHGAVTPAKAQGTCGTCWSFATVAMCESSLILQGRAVNNKIYQVDLSEQFLLKCTVGNSCSGGYLENAIDKALKNGLPYESSFAYQPYSSNNKVCTTKDLITISNKTRVSKYHIDDNSIIGMLQDGPVVGAVSATGWQKYSTGVFTCTPNAQINHAVQIVGYTPSYWIIKNSWGTDFGIKGFIYVTRDASSNCGIGTAVHELGQFYGDLPRFLWILLLIAILFM